MAPFGPIARPGTLARISPHSAGFLPELWPALARIRLGARKIPGTLSQECVAFCWVREKFPELCRRNVSHSAGCAKNSRNFVAGMCRRNVSNSRNFGPRRAMCEKFPELWPASRNVAKVPSRAMWPKGAKGGPHRLELDKLAPALEC